MFSTIADAEAIVRHGHPFTDGIPAGSEAQAMGTLIRIGYTPDEADEIVGEAMYAAQPSSQCSHQGVCFHPSV